MAQLDENKLHEFVGKMLGDLGGAFSVPTVRIGLRLGLFDALHEGGPATSDELAKRAGGLTERYVREWALAQAANGFVDYNATSRKFSLSPEQAMVFAEKDSPVYLAGAFDIVAAMIEGSQRSSIRSERVPVCAGAIRQGAFSAQPVRSSDRAM